MKNIFIVALFIAFFSCAKKEDVKPMTEQETTQITERNYYSFRVEARNNNKPIRYIISKQDTTIKRGNNVYSLKEPLITELPNGYFTYTDTILKRNMLEISLFNKLFSDTSKIEMLVYIDNSLVYSNKSSNPKFNK